MGEPIEAKDKQRLEDTAAYLVRSPLSLKKLVYLDGHQAVLYRSRMKWLARISDHIPDPGQHRTLFYGEYASRVRGASPPPEPDAHVATAESPPRRRCSQSWARMIAKVYQVDPLICSRCGQRMSLLAFVTDQVSIARILDHLGLRAPEQDRPPPPREVLRVAEQGDGWGVPADWP